MSTIDQPAQGRAADILARLDRLPGTRHVWMMVTLLSLGGMFELYDLFMTAYVVPGLLKAGMLKDVSVSIFAGPALFVAATFTGLFIGTCAFGYAADKYGRRTVFTYSMLWYSAATFVMAFQNTGLGVSLWRLIAGIGIGVELVTIDTYVSELVPKSMRGRAFAFNQGVMFSVVPIVAFVAYMLVPISPFGVDGWRWVVLIGSTGALVVWFIRRSVPESPRWLINQGRLDEADAVTTGIEAKVRSDLKGAALATPGSHAVEKVERQGRLAEIFAPSYRSRTFMLMIFQFFQTFGFYGFAAWVPTLIAQQTGINVGKSLLYSFIIAIANPFGPMLAMSFADKFERKWQLVAAACCIGIFGMLFSYQSTMPLLILFGVLITLSNNILSYSFHNYQAELFPARIRARAVGFTYSLSRLSAIFASFIIGFFLQTAGTKGVFGLIAGAMLIVVVAIAGWGPRTLDRELEEISG
ncbi:MFS transporter [Bradyrhizobium sp. ISRA443]|uniref:MFS transporter n=1 Tax=unclassified Bradyrhizobium TaxID=2631580 RepID=UPI0024791F62|nr:MULTISPECIES: MFS transporter [unclassified Bradyrhizobium]WGR98452.1 MFS transporter [Bradyrhizobium sp. ISRA436]WGS05341.1 MFS transporter [Bradyrhizobium sp. ISRA437]WGS12227.1 MFS transporter [Bradyrhizobium sp. ISRA443]